MSMIFYWHYDLNGTETVFNRDLVGYGVESRGEDLRWRSAIMTLVIEFAEDRCGMELTNAESTLTKHDET